MSSAEFDADEPFEEEGLEQPAAFEEPEALEAEGYEEEGFEGADDYDEEPAAPEAPSVVEKQLLNVYTVMLLISLTALSIGITSLMYQWYYYLG